jgi:hypothetical protein
MGAGLDPWQEAFFMQNQNPTICSQAMQDSASFKLFQRHLRMDYYSLELTRLDEIKWC